MARLLLVSTYELGRQPLHVASPAAALRTAGHEVRALDLSVDDWDDDAVDRADAVAFSVPMHTAMRLALQGAERARARRPGLPLAFYGLYAGVGEWDGARRFAGEYEPALVEWADALGTGDGDGGVVVHLGRSEFRQPARDVLPPLDRYGALLVGDERHLVGAVEASHGCSELCRHCPVPAVYHGRTRVVDLPLLLADVEALVAAGATHVTFGDPDFLSGPAHARRVVAAFGERFPGITFDVTTKVEHVLRHDDLWPDMAAAGCRFVVTAVESMDDAILAVLDKGHTAADARAAVTLLRHHGIDAHPSFLPFTPWTTAGGLLDILDFVAAFDLVDVVDPVQFSLRLLLPDGSLLLDRPEMRPHLDGYDADGLTWRWRAADPAVDALQADLAALVEEGVAAGRPHEAVYQEVRSRVAAAAGVPGRVAPPAVDVPAPPGPRARLSEPWFCCAEPTRSQLGVLRAD